MSLTTEQSTELSELEELLFCFWEKEKEMCRRLRDRHEISDSELHEYILRKSSDSFLYTKIAEFSAPISEEVKQELYSQQLRKDFQDDFDDLFEDHQQSMPNPFLLRLYRRGIPIDDCHDQKRFEKRVHESGIFQEHKDFIDEQCQKLKCGLPPEFSWIRKTFESENLEISHDVSLASPRGALGTSQGPDDRIIVSPLKPRRI